MARSLRLRAASTFAACLAIAACSQAPRLAIPDVPVGARYKETGAWTQAQPAAELPHDAWWTLYGDTELNELEARLLQSSPDLVAALARYQQSRSYYDELRANQWPTLAFAANTQKDRQSESKPLRVLGPNSPDEYRSTTLGVALSYEFDLWGRVRNLVASGRALDEAARSDLESARLSLQAELADAYLTLRGIDREVQLLRDTEAAYAREYELIRSRHDGGIASGLDVARAEATLQNTRSQLRQTLASRALVEHAIASLVGAPATDFSIEPRSVALTLPQVPLGVPSTLLQRRPDVAAAQQRIVAANADVGVARTAYFPTLTLDAQYGYQSSEFSDLVRAPNVFWAVGPTLFMDLFDGGRRKAQVARARAVLDEAGANYRSVVLGAFQDVEDSLALLENYRSAAESQAAAVAAAQRSLDLATNRYREGAASYLEVVVSQASTLQARRDAEDLATRQLRASVRLIRALGGGWTGG